MTRDFKAPTAWYEDRAGDYELVAKFMGNLWRAQLDHSPLNVVAWNGNYTPYKYDLRRFNTIVLLATIIPIRLFFWCCIPSAIRPASAISTS